MFFRPPFLLLLCALLTAALRPASAQIYADVAVSGGVAGTFTITLEHQLKPTTVANFIALATGSRGWLDPATGAIRYEPFYQGVTFHRVIKDFMSQTGSRLGDGSDGLGYTFPDEALSTLPHDSAYVVSMANSGKNTNGSQFFVTDVPTPWTFSGGSPMAITSASFTPGPYAAQLYLALSNNMQFLLTLNYTTTTSGTYTGQMTVSPP